MADSGQAKQALNTEFPNAARVYDYTLGGSHNFDADRQAAEYMFSLVPSTRKWVRMLRAFLQEAATQLWEEGFTHFVDFASGLPTSDHVHATLPEAKVVYSDTDPLTIAEATAMLAGNPNVIYRQADVQRPLDLLNSAEVQKFLGDQRKVAIGLNGITVFLPPADIRVMFRELYDWAAPGSKLYITWETKHPNLMTPQMQQFIDMFHKMNAPFWLYSLDECLDMSAPWQVDHKGLVTVREFLGLPEDYVTEADHEGVGLEFYAAIMEKR